MNETPVPSENNEPIQIGSNDVWSIYKSGRPDGYSGLFIVITADAKDYHAAAIARTNPKENSEVTIKHGDIEIDMTYDEFLQRLGITPQWEARNNG